MKHIVQISVLIINICFSYNLLFSQQAIIPQDDLVYNQLDILLLESGHRPTFQRRPFSINELRQNLAIIDYSSLSSSGKALYDRILTRFKIKPLYSTDSFILSIRPIAAIEGYFSSGNDGYWQFGYEKRLPILRLPFEIIAGQQQQAQFLIDISLKEEYRAISEDTANFSNIPKDLKHLDWYFPFRAFTSIGGDWWNLQFGRDTLDWGNGLSGNLILSGNADFHDNLTLRLFWPHFSFTSVYLLLDPWLTPEEHEFWSNQPKAGWYHNYNEQYKAFAGHRFDMAIGRHINLAITEGALFGNKYPQLNDLNPAMILHNYFMPERSNSIFSLEIDITPMKYFSIAGQFAIDEFETAYEAGKGSRPGATAWLANLQVAIPASNGYLRLLAEYVQIDPWMYNRWHPNTRLTNRRRIWSYIPPDGYIWINKPLGHGAGPDSDVLYAGILWDGRLPADLSLEVGIDFQWRRHSNINLDTPYNLYQSADELRELWRYDRILELHARIQLPWQIQSWLRLLLCDYVNFGGEAGRREFRTELTGGLSWQF